MTRSLEPRDDEVVDICYVVPVLEPDGASHFAHLPFFLREVGRHCRLAVLAEKSTGESLIPGVEVIRQRHGRSGRARRMLELLVLARRLRRRGCRRFFVRISTTAGVTLALASRWLGISVYYWNSGQATRILPPWHRHPLSRFKASARLVPLRITLRFADRLVTGPERMVDYYRRAYGVPANRCIVLYNDVDAKRFAPVEPRTIDVRERFGLPDKGPLLIFVHHLSRRKGCFDVAPIVSRLSDDVACLVVGDGPHRTRMQAQLDERGLGARVRIVGAVPNLDLPELYQAADIAIMPSHEEGFPRVALEAMASGLPLVAYDVGGIRDLVNVRQQAYVLPDGDVAAFAAAVAQLVADPDERSGLGQENRAAVERFDTARVAQMFIARVVDP